MLIGLSLRKTSKISYSKNIFEPDCMFLGSQLKLILNCPFSVIPVKGRSDLLGFTTK